MATDLDGLFDEETYYTGPALSEALVANAERLLGVTLPIAYVEVLRYKNGGSLLRRKFPTRFPTSWADDHFEVRAILGVGGATGIDSPDGGSRHLIEEWEYPSIGVVFAECPSGGHDTVMLDYTKRNATGEPTVAYIDEDRVPRTVADSFNGFLEHLENAD
ncbi:SMI1/KNR4 family protein [Glycomyces tenuis]|uniref:SMI1/KNR4 family protein n=1 Tax=Glycomyces tenuis TaxID=58116 RepID=UPI00041DD107|nr:SMI1/KNR4 family protein [Glycomyces tenuis]